jgi:hypothetical protein
LLGFRKSVYRRSYKLVHVRDAGMIPSALLNNHNHIPATPKGSLDRGSAHVRTRHTPPLRVTISFSHVAVILICLVMEASCGRSA